MAPSEVSSNGVSSAGPDQRALQPGKEAEFDDDKALTVAIMGVLYTVCKEKSRPSFLLIGFRLLADALQLWLIMINPQWMNIPSDALWWQILNFVQLTQFMSARGYSFFLACFYILFVGLVVSVAVSVWVGLSFQANRFVYIWPIVFLRWFAKIFYQILDIMSMTLFLIALDCQYFARPADQIGRNQEYPTIQCWAMPHVVHAAIAVISMVIFVTLAGAFTLGEMELSFATHNPLAVMHTGIETWTFAIRVLMTLTSVFVTSQKWCSVALVILSAWLTFLVWKWQPQLFGWVNHVRTGSYTSVCWCGILFVFIAFGIGVDLSDAAATARHVATLTTIMWATFFPVGLLGAFASWLRLRYFHTTVLNRFRNAKYEHLRPHEIYEITDARVCEILARCCRVWIDRDTLDPEAVALAEAVIKCGLAQLPKDPYMILLSSSFLIDVHSSYQSGHAQLEVAKKLESSFLMRFAIFSREQQHTQRSAGGSGGQGEDLVSFVEFQRNYALALKSHREALQSITHVWETLFHNSVKFSSLAAAIRVMDKNIKIADRVYKLVLSRHTSSILMVRLYAKFLEGVRNDPWSAAKWFGEAEKLELAEEEIKNQEAIDGLDVSDPELRAAMQNAGPALGGGHGSQGGPAVVIANALGVIQITNQAAQLMFGYGRAEFRGKNVSILMTPAIASVHNTFLRNYLVTGNAHILGIAMHQLAVHKDRRLLPLMVTISRVTGVGEDSMYLSVMEPVKLSADVATMWVLHNGDIIHVCDTFLDWFGYVASEVVGTSVMQLVTTKSHEVTEALAAARHSMAREHARARKQVVEAGNHNAIRQASMGASHSSHTLRRPGQANVGKPSINSIAAASLPEAQSKWNVESVHVAHHFAEPCDVDISITNGGAAAVVFHCVQLSARVAISRQAIPLSRMATKPSINDIPTLQTIHSHADDTVGEGVTMDVNACLSEMLTAVAPANPAPPRDSLLSWMSSAISPKSSFLGYQQNLADNATAPWYHEANIQPLMLVTNSRGQVCHVTRKLAQMLGRTVQQLKGNGTDHALKEMLVQPFQGLHRVLCQSLPASAAPPYSCRSGLTQLFAKTGVQGRLAAVCCRMQMQRRAGLDDMYHIVRLKEASLSEALDERRLGLKVDSNGRIVYVTEGTPASLFGFDVLSALGQNVADILEFLNASSFGTAKEICPQVLLELAACASEAPGGSWRVAVSLNSDQRLPMIHKGKAAGLLARHNKPAIMQVHVNFSEMNHLSLSSMTLQINLWRADLVTSVVELDSNGYIVPSEISEIMDLYPSGLVMGAASDALLDKPIHHLLPALENKQHLLFEQGSFGPVPPGFQPDVFGHGRPHEPQVLRPPQMRSNQRGLTAPIPGPQAKPSPVHILQMKHTGDGQDIVVSVQAVHKAPGGVYLVMHALNPGTGRRDLADYLLSERPGPDAVAVLAPLDPTGACITPPVFPRPPVVSALALRPAFVTKDSATDDGSSMAHGQGNEPHAAASRSARVSRSAQNQTVAQWLRRSSIDQYGPLQPGSTQTQVPLQGPVTLDANDEGQMKDGLFLKAGDNEAGADEDQDRQSSNAPDCFEEEKGADKLQDAAGDDEVISDSHYLRGKRFVKLHRLMSSPAVQVHVHRLRKHTLLLVLALVACHVGLFALMFTLLSNQAVMVTTLSNIGNAGLEASIVATYTRTLNFLYSGLHYPGLPLLQGQTDIPYLKEVYLSAIIRFTNLHALVHKDMTVSGRIPDDYGLHQLWVGNSLNSTLIANILFNNFTLDPNTNYTIVSTFTNTSMIGLWEAGLQLSSHATSLLQTADFYNQTYGPDGWSTHPDLSWIVTNAAGVIFAGYKSAMVEYLQLVLASSKQVNSYQLILLAVEGGVLCFVCVLWVWILLQAVATRRFIVMQMLVAVPLAMVKRMSTKRYKLSDEEEDDTEWDDGALGGVLGLGGGTKTLEGKAEEAQASTKVLPFKGKARFEQEPEPEEAHQIKAAAPADPNGDAGSTGAWSWLAACLPGLVQHVAPNLASSNSVPSRRSLLPSKATQIWLIWPLAVWGLLVMVLYAIAYSLLANVHGPIALFSIVSYTQMLYNANNFQIQELAWEPDFTKLPDLRSQTFMRVNEIETSYNIMLNGAEDAYQAAGLPFSLVKTGIINTGTDGSRILFDTEQCLCANQSECQPSNSLIYPLTSHGLNRMVQRYIDLGKTIPYLTGLDPAPSSPVFQYFWKSRPDMIGGFAQLSKAYSDFVMVNLKNVLTLHIILLVLILLLLSSYVFLMLLPFIKSTTFETRRIAELISQLPIEVDVEGILSRTLLAGMHDRHSN